MDIHKLLNELDKLNLPKDQYLIVSSGALAIRGIRKANDLDILVTESLWNGLKKDHKVEIANGHVENINFGNIQILGQGSIYRREEFGSPEDMINNADEIEGFKFINLDLLKQIKQKQGREKDIKDVGLINQYLSNK